VKVVGVGGGPTVLEHFFVLPTHNFLLEAAEDVKHAAAYSSSFALFRFPVAELNYSRKPLNGGNPPQQVHREDSV